MKTWILKRGYKWKNRHVESIPRMGGMEDKGE
jgi:hypothetical protein